MSGFPTVNFGQSESGPFSPEEIRRLMEGEYQRALRYGFPLSLLHAEIDRLESLHDLYGVESEQRILRAVAGLLRSSTRASDLMGVPLGQRLLVMLPHTPRAAAVAIARRLLEGCRALEFRGDGRILRASLSIGIAAHADESSVAELIERSGRALDAALAAGGDRFLEYERLPGSSPTPARSVEVPPVVPARPRAPAPKPAVPPLPAVRDLPGATLEEKVKALIELAFGPGDRTGLEHQIVAILRSTLDGGLRRRASRAEVQEELRALERRVAELGRLLEASEEDLARMVREKSLEPGVASVYRSVQGLDPSERNFKKKKELLAVIYQANVELLKQLRRESGQE